VDLSKEKVIHVAFAVTKQVLKQETLAIFLIRVTVVRTDDIVLGFLDNVGLSGRGIAMITMRKCQ
jgi:hypothetical protein